MYLARSAASSRISGDGEALDGENRAAVLVPDRAWNAEVRRRQLDLPVDGVLAGAVQDDAVARVRGELPAAATRDGPAESGLGIPARTEDEPLPHRIAAGS